MSGRLASWSLYPVRIPYERTVTWATQTVSDIAFAILRLEAEDGTVGVGEVHVNPQWFGVTFRSLQAALEDVFIPLLAKDGLDPQTFGRSAAAYAENRSAKALVDAALRDVAGAASGTPFWAQFGEERPEVCWTVTRQSPARMAEEAAQVVERYGFRTLKLKGGQGFDVDRDGIRAIRKGVGDEVRFFLDCNSHYSADDAPRYLEMAAAEGVVAVEDPCRIRPNDAFARLQDSAELPIVLDAPCPSLRDAELFCDLRARAIALKLGRIGISESFAIADLARGRGCAVHVGLTMESVLGSLAALGVAKQLTSPATWLPSETTTYLMHADRITVDPLPVVDGHVRLPRASGLAQLVDWERVARLHP